MNSYTWYDFKVANIWQDAIPLGNGKIGALVFGDRVHERVILNHENLWLPVRPSLPLNDMTKYRKEAEELASAGKFSELATFWYKRAAVHKDVQLYWPNAFQPGCELKIELEDVPLDSRRLNIADGYLSINGHCAFVSRKENMFVYILAEDYVKDIKLEAVTLTNEKAWDGTDISSMIDFESKRDEDWLILEGKYSEKHQFLGKSYGAIAKINRINGKIILLAKVYNQVEWESGIEELKKDFVDVTLDYDKLFNEHVKLHSASFNSCKIELCNLPEVISSQEIVDNVRKNSALTVEAVQAFYSYGRYLLISSSGNLPANLQGVWNGAFDPPWQCDYTQDENIQMNYWQALSGNMPEMMHSYCQLIKRQLDNWRENARKSFGCNGIMASTKSTTDGLAHHISEQWCWQFWTAGAGWLSELMVDYYRYTLDKEFLRDEVYPILKEIYAFYKDYLKLEADGKLHFWCGISPENTPTGTNSMLSKDPTMDVAVAREVLRNLLDICEVLELSKDEKAKYQEMLDKMVDYCANEDGALKEWLDPNTQDNYLHRHQSHIYPLFPGLEVKLTKNEELMEMCRVAVAKRLENGLEAQTGWSLTHMANIFARLSWQEYAVRCLELEILGQVGPNFFAYHDKLIRSDEQTRKNAKFQIDANFGFSAAVQEMLLFTTSNIIEVLPCLPKDWRVGKVSKMFCRANRHISFSWDMDKGEFEATILPHVAGKFEFKLFNLMKEFECVAEVPIKISAKNIDNSWQF